MTLRFDFIFVGVSLGSLSAGYLIDTYQGMTTFRIFSGGALAWLAIFWVLQLLLRKSKSLPLSQGHSRKGYIENKMFS